jgi:uncharacterized membrane protein HdeD (DUF308 family)
MTKFLRAFDRQDLLLVVGIVSLVGGIAAWSRPAAAVVFGLLCLGCVLLIERARNIASIAAHAEAEKGSRR